MTLHTASGPVVSAVFRHVTAMPALQSLRSRLRNVLPPERRVVTEVTVMLAACVEDGRLCIRLEDLQVLSFAGNGVSNDIMAETVTVTLSMPAMALQLAQPELSAAGHADGVPQVERRLPWDALIVRLANGRWSYEIRPEVGVGGTVTAKMGCASKSAAAEKDTIVGKADSMLTLFRLSQPSFRPRSTPGAVAIELCRDVTNTILLRQLQTANGMQLLKPTNGVLFKGCFRSAPADITVHVQVDAVFSVVTTDMVQDSLQLVNPVYMTGSRQPHSISFVKSIVVKVQQ